jgi:hypothetical protein
VAASTTQYGYPQEEYTASNLYTSYYGQLLDLAVATDVASSRVLEIPLAPDATIEHASFTVRAAAPAGLVALADVAEVRAADAESSATRYAVVIDFGRLTSIADLSVGTTPFRYYRWNGTSWESEGDRFSELGTERLLVEFEDLVAVQDVVADGTVRLPARPTGLELLVEGTVVWSEQQGGPPPQGGVTAGVGFVVDRTVEVQEAVRRKRAATADPKADISVRVEFRTAYPGDLALEPEVRVRRSHVVAFPNGPTRTVERDGEGSLVLDLPLPDTSGSWLVGQVDVTVRATVGAERVQPAEGPSFTPDASLSLTPSRTVMIRLPDGLVGRFATVNGVRLPLSGGGEIGGRLLASTAPAGETGAPGEPVEGAVVTPITVPAGDVAAWTTIPLAAPIPAAGGPYWLELAVSYGDVTLQLTESPADDAGAPGAVVHRRLAGGGTKQLTAIAQLGQLHAAVRIVGTPDANAPINALSLNILLPDAETGGGVDPAVAVGVTPTADGVPAELGLPGAITPVANTLTLVGTAAVAGSFTFDRITVVYYEPEESTP